MLPPNSSPIVCYIARHGQTALNAEKKFRGNANPPLDETGIKDAHALAHLFSNIPLSYIFCSNKRRSIQTAEIIAAERGIPIHKTDALAALNVGDFSGKLRTPESEKELESYLNNPDVRVPGGESLNEFKARIDPSIQQAIDIFMETGVPALLASHSSVVHEASALAYGDHKAVLVHPGGAVALYFRNGKLQSEAIHRPLKVQPGKAGTIT